MTPALRGPTAAGAWRHSNRRGTHEVGLVGHYDGWVAVATGDVDERRVRARRARDRFVARRRRALPHPFEQATSAIVGLEAPATTVEGFEQRGRAGTSGRHHLAALARLITRSRYHRGTLSRSPAATSAHPRPHQPGLWSDDSPAKRSLSSLATTTLVMKGSPVRIRASALGSWSQIGETRRSRRRRADGTEAVRARAISASASRGATLRGRRAAARASGRFGRERRASARRGPRACASGRAPIEG